MGAVQRCQYRGTVCAGCGLLMRRGEQVRASGGGLVHARSSCVEAAASRRWRERGADAAEAARGQTSEVEDARAYATWAALEREFALGGEAGSGRLLLPRHSKARFLEMVEWMARDAGRRAALPTVLRATGIYTHRTWLEDWGADAGVRARVDALLGRAAQHGPASG